MPKTSSARVKPLSRMALVVHSDLGVLSKLQAALTENGFTTIVARDLPTALLAITQHYFVIAIVSSQLREPGDGWPLAGVVHLVFPRSFVSVLAPSEIDVLTLQSAINYGVKEVYKESTPAEEIAEAMISAIGQTPGTARVQ